jgi:polyribonucleotide nucleotidyltransferase
VQSFQNIIKGKAKPSEKPKYQASAIAEHVSVPSTRHVAEIVGSNGTRIKELRERTNTVIKTPARHEPSIFVIIGTPKDVKKARNEIVFVAKMITKLHSMSPFPRRLSGMTVIGHVG